MYDVGVGAWLGFADGPIDDYKSWRVNAFASKALTETQRRASTPAKELCAVWLKEV